jgi:transcriptional regulator with XRE-family HTH domain
VTVATAVKELREHFGDSQQAFATRMKLSIRAIANYEATRVPTASVLALFGVTAAKAGRRDLIEVFATALIVGLNLEDKRLHILSMKRDTPTGPGRGFLMAQLDNDDKVRYAGAFRDMLMELDSTDPGVRERARARLSKLADEVESDPGRVPEWAQRTPEQKRARERR